MKVFAALLISIFILHGCAVTPPPGAYLNADIRYDLPTNPWQGGRLDAFQQLTIAFEDKVLFLQVFIALAPGQAKITLLDMSGRRALDINWGRDDLQIYRADWLPKSARAEDVLARLVLAYWPVDIARMGLPAAAKLRLQENERFIETASGLILSNTSNAHNP